MPTDGWGSSSMLYGFFEGLVGVQDKSQLFKNVALSPRWHAAGVSEAEVRVGYEISCASVAYSYRESPNGISLSIEAEQTEAGVHLLLPIGAIVHSVTGGQGSIPFTVAQVEESRYLDFETEVIDGIDLSVSFK